MVSAMSRSSRGGAFGQNVFVDPEHQIVIATFSSQAPPLDECLVALTMRGADAVCWPGGLQAHDPLAEAGFPRQPETGAGAQHLSEAQGSFPGHRYRTPCGPRVDGELCASLRPEGPPPVRSPKRRQCSGRAGRGLPSIRPWSGVPWRSPGPGGSRFVAFRVVAPTPMAPNRSQPQARREALTW